MKISSNCFSLFFKSWLKFPDLMLSLKVTYQFFIHGIYSFFVVLCIWSVQHDRQFARAVWETACLNTISIMFILMIILTILHSTIHHSVNFVFSFKNIREFAFWLMQQWRPILLVPMLPISAVFSLKIPNIVLSLLTTIVINRIYYFSLFSNEIFQLRNIQSAHELHCSLLLLMLFIWWAVSCEKKWEAYENWLSCKTSKARISELST